MLLNELETYTKMLFVHKHRLDDELQMQGEIMFRIAENMATANAVANQSKDDLKSTEARLFVKYSDDNKEGVAKTNHKVNIDPERTKAYRKMIADAKEAEKWGSLYDAWKARGFALKSLCELHLANYYTKDSFTSSETVTSDYDNDREAIRKGRSGIRQRVSASTPRRKVVE